MSEVARRAAGRSDQDPRRPSRPPAQGHRGLPVHHPAALGRAGQERPGGRPRALREPRDHAGRPARRRQRQPWRGRPLRGGHRGGDHADAQAAGRPHPHPGPGAGAGARAAHQPDGALSPGQDRAHRGARSGGALAGDRGPGAQRQGEHGPRRHPRQGDLGRGDGDRRQPGGSGAAGRSRGEQPGAQAQRGAVGAGDDRSDRAPEAGERSAGARDPGAQPAAGDLLAGARRDRPQPARILPAPAAQGDPAGARRGRGARRGDRQLSQAGRREAAHRRGPRGAGAADPPPRAQPPRERRDADHPHLSRLADRAPLEHTSRRTTSTSRTRRRCSTRITTISKRSRSASSNISPCAS